jgi:hypothetical protein
LVRVVKVWVVSTSRWPVSVLVPVVETAATSPVTDAVPVSAALVLRRISFSPAPFGCAVRVLLDELENAVVATLSRGACQRMKEGLLNLAQRIG